MHPALRHFYYSSSRGGYSAGLRYLEENAKAYWDFTALSGADGAAITSLSDLSPNGRNLSNASPAQSPTTTKVVNGANEYNVYKAYPSAGSKDVLLSSAVGNDLFRTSFEVFVVFSATYSATIYDFDLCGVGDSSTDFFRMSNLINAGNFQWNFQYRYSAGGGKFFFALGPTTLVSAFPMGKTLVRFKMDFENDVCKLFHNGQDLALTFNTGNEISTLTPINFNCPTSKFCVGGRNDSGVITARGNAHNQYAFAITPILTNQEAVDVSNYLINEIAA